MPEAQAHGLTEKAGPRLGPTGAGGAAVTGRAQPFVFRLMAPIMRLDVFLDEAVPDFPFAQAVLWSLSS